MNPLCPECGGRWLDDYRFDHTNTCSIRAALDATHAADLQNMHPSRYLRVVRASTGAELRLLEAFGRTPSDNPMTVITAVTAGVVHRTVDGYDPDRPDQEDGQLHD